MKVKEGDIFTIPGTSNFGVAKVIYLSEYFKDVILIKLYQVSYDSQVDISIPEGAEFSLYYTGIDSVKKGKWEYLGCEAVGAEEKQLTKRIVGGDVWIEDQHLGTASEKERVELPKMQTYGYRLIEKAVTSLS